jgi:hypothetical protein
LPKNKQIRTFLSINTEELKSFPQYWTKLLYICPDINEIAGKFGTTETPITVGNTINNVETTPTYDVQMKERKKFMLITCNKM